MSNETQEFNQELAWGVFEQFASGDFNEVADYNFGSVESFFSGSVDFVRKSSQQKYKKALYAACGMEVK